MSINGIGTFDAYLKATGITVLPHRYDVHREHFVNAFSKVAEGVMDRAAEEGRPLELEFCFIDAPGLNAFAATFADTDVVALHRDVIPLLVATSKGLMSHSDLFPEIATPNCVVSPRMSSGSSKEVVLGIASIDPRDLEDPLRDRMADAISGMAIWFILHHELAHIINGHTRWLRENRQLGLIVEVERPQYPVMSGMERETLEWDADASAVNNLIMMALKPVRRKEGGREWWEIPPQNSIGSIEDAIACVTSALFICAKYFSSMDDGDIRDPAPRSHPHPLMRLWAGMLTISQNIKFRTGAQHPDYLSHMFKTGIECSRAWNKLFGEMENID
ncbi:MAG: hypothetical protein ABIV36_10200, partial [Sphingobium limneticum]